MKNFRNVESWSTDLTARDVLIVGDHETGKSTRLDAIRWALTGRCRGLDAAGRGVEVLYRQGGVGELVVSATVVHNGQTKTLTRCWDPKIAQVTLAVTGLKGTLAQQQQAFLDWLEVPSVEVVTAVLDTEYFGRLAHQDAKALLLAVLKPAIVLPGSGETIDTDELETRYGAAFEQRRVAKKALQALPVTTVPDQSVGDLEGTVTLLASLRAELEGVVTQKGQQVGGAASLFTAERRQVELDVERYRAAVVGLRDDDELQSACQMDTEVLAEGEIELAALNAKIASLVVPSGVSSLSHEIEILSEHTPADGCVLHRDIPCLTKAAQFAKGIKALQAKLDESSEVLRQQGELRTAFEQLRERIALRKLAVARSANDLRHAQQQRAALVAAEARLTELGEAPAAEAVQVSPLDAQIATLRERIAKGEAIVDGKRKRQQQLIAHEQAMASRATLEAEVEASDAAVTLYGPAGVRVQALATAVGSFQEGINAALEPFGYTFVFHVEPWQIQVNGLPVVALSASAQWRVGVALQVALAVTSGLGIALVDQLELLLPPTRKLVSQMLRQVPLEQLVLVKAMEPQDGPVAAPTGAQVIAL